MNSVKLNGQEIHPSKIICIGRNYADHIEELENNTPIEPVIFIKPNSSISTDIYFNETDSIHYEGEISFVLHNNVISGVGIGIDLTKRKIQTSLKNNGLPWERSKSFDKSAVFSKFITINNNMSSLKLELYKNNNLVQLAEYFMMLNKPNILLNEIKSFLSFEDGDILMTGTPKGVGEIHKGDQFLGKLFDGNNLLIEESWVVK